MWYDSLIRLATRKHASCLSQNAAQSEAESGRMPGWGMWRRRRRYWDLIYVITLFVTAIRTNYALKMYSASEKRMQRESRRCPEARSRHQPETTTRGRMAFALNSSAAAEFFYSICAALELRWLGRKEAGERAAKNPRQCSNRRQSEMEHNCYGK